MTEVLSRFPTNHDNHYEIQAPRRVGEQVLSELAVVGVRQFTWTYDARAKLWTHILGKRTEMVEYDEDGSLTSRSSNIVVSDIANHLQSDKTSFYQVSSVLNFEGLADDPIRDKNAPVMQQVPSDTAVEACVRMGLVGYRDYRVVSTLSVTMMKLGEVDMDATSIFIPGFTISGDEIHGWVENAGLVGAARKTISRLDEHFGDLIDVSFYEIKENK